MLKGSSRAILKLIGWRAHIILPEDKKFVLIFAPHTSNWDFPLGLIASWTIDPKISWVAKIQLFRGPLNYLFTALGGIPVDRNATSGFIEQVVDRFNRSDEMILAIAPEGTRSKTDYWKTGFYYIAVQAKVPIYLGYINYSNRTLGFAERLIPCGDIEKDFARIRSFYQDKKGLFPDKHGSICIRDAH